MQTCGVGVWSVRRDRNGLCKKLSAEFAVRGLRRGGDAGVSEVWLPRGHGADGGGGQEVEFGAAEPCLRCMSGSEVAGGADA